jgi:peptidoglycan hydrolase-like protein with peptidoglycan-binding domain
MSTTSGSTGRRWRLRLGAGLALAAVTVVIVVAVLVTGSSPTPSAASPTGSGSVSVERRNLVLTDTESGTIGYSNPQTVYDRLSGTITWLPQVGQRIGRGQALFRVDGQPVPLLYGATPAFRSLSADDSAGADIEQLNRNLIVLGFNPGGIVDDDIWQPATTLGVEQFQASLGETETGVLELGQVVFLPGVQLVAALDGSVGATGGGGGGGASSSSAGSGGGTSSGASTHLAPARPEFVGLVLGLGKHGDTPGPSAAPSKPPAPASPGRPAPSTAQPPASRHHARAGGRQRRASESERELAALTALLRAETAQLRAQSAALRAAKTAAQSAAHASTSTSTSPSASGGGSSAAGGSATGGASPTAVLETTSPRLVVTVDLPASAQSEAQVGDRVTVELPAGNAVGGAITAVSRIAVSSSGSGSGGGGGAGGSGSGSGSGSGGATSSVPVTISMHGHLRAAGLDQAAVSVNFTQQRANNVLSVPVTALLAVPGSNYVLQEASTPHKMIPVQTGLFAAGYVQVSGPGLYPGLSVTASQG